MRLWKRTQNERAAGKEPQSMGERSRNAISDELDAFTFSFQEGGYVCSIPFVYWLEFILQVTVCRVEQHCTVVYPTFAARESARHPLKHTIYFSTSGDQSSLVTVSRVKSINTLTVALFGRSLNSIGIS
jgi:hypothetical protein